MFLPDSTYRIQFNARFPFSELEKQLDYLSLLGIATVYASPIFQSTPGSDHGYDVTYPAMIDPELGGEEGFGRLCQKLKEKQIGWLQDIVPNHMAFNRHNPWLWDVFEKGIDSEFAGIFDIDWSHPDFEGKLMAPFLGKPMEQVLEDGELQLVFEKGDFYIKYFGELYPVNLPGFQMILRINQNQFPPELIEFKENTGSRENSGNSSSPIRPWKKMKEILHKSNFTSAETMEWIDGILSEINADPSRLRSLLDVQYYRLCFWKRTEKMINFRRFFTVNGLICLRMEDPRVFEYYHSYLHDLLKKEAIDGLRIDHIDGLLNPDTYLDRLRKLVSEDTYLTVEKILEKNEELPRRWNVQGTTGYDFLAYVNNLLTNMGQYPDLKKFYREITGIRKEVEDIIYDNKKFILLERMAGELDNLSRTLWTSGLVPVIQQEGTDQDCMKAAIAEFLIAFPVYRLYSISIPPDEENGFMLNHIFAQAISRNPSMGKELNILKDLFMGKDDPDHLYNEQVLNFFNRCMQFTGPLMAKGVEDTTMYFFNQFVAHNEVGDHPGSSGSSVTEFHVLMQHRQGSWPASMNSTSTHDTKRGEDVRARLNVISDHAHRWMNLVRKWMEMNANFKLIREGKGVPTPNEEYLIYQTLSGVWPMDDHLDDDFKDRVINYFIKAMREAKVHTAWSDPAKEHEEAVIGFIHHLLDPETPFYSSFLKFQRIIRQYGMLNSLVQLILKMTCPGIPDLYQGTELWDLTLVDPDNRQPVDYDIRKIRLQELVARGNDDRLKLWKEVTGDAVNGDVKLWLTHLLLSERKRNPELFSSGEYIPFEIDGKFRHHAISFCRKLEGNRVIVILPVNLGDIQENYMFGKEKIDWQDTSVYLKEGISGKYLDIISQEKYSIGSSIRPVNFSRSDPLILLRSLQYP